jgi:hypothetical protein
MMLHYESSQVVWKEMLGKVVGSVGGMIEEKRSFL